MAPSESSSTSASPLHRNYSPPSTPQPTRSTRPISPCPRPHHHRDNTPRVTDVSPITFPGMGLPTPLNSKASYCQNVRPDLLWGGDIRNFHPPANRFDGIIGGLPCQDFSRARRNILPTGNGEAMLLEYARSGHTSPAPMVAARKRRAHTKRERTGYITHRIDLNALECGSNQNRLRHFQFGSLNGITITPNVMHQAHMLNRAPPPPKANDQPPLMARLLRTPRSARDFTLPGFTVEESYRRQATVSLSPWAAASPKPSPPCVTPRRITSVTPAQHHSSTPASHSHICDIHSAHNRDSTIVHNHPYAPVAAGRQIVGRIDKPVPHQAAATP